MFEHTGSKAAVSSCQCHAGELNSLPLFSRKGIVQLLVFLSPDFFFFFGSCCRILTYP